MEDKVKLTSPYVYENYKFVLGSGSPRRKMLLESLGIKNFMVKTANIEETYPMTLKPNEVALYLAQQKHEALKPQIPADTFLITADTTVVYHSEILNKPKDKKNAFEMLSQLSGQTHQVISGLSVSFNQLQLNKSHISEVSFCQLKPEEINYYIEQYLPLDKAGAYGIQEWIGHIGIETLKGDYNNVMGLSTVKLHQMIKKILDLP